MRRPGHIRKNLKQILERAALNVANQLRSSRVGRFSREMFLGHARHVRQRRM